MQAGRALCAHSVRLGERKLNVIKDTGQLQADTAQKHTGQRPHVLQGLSNLIVCPFGAPNLFKADI